MGWVDALSRAGAPAPRAVLATEVRRIRARVEKELAEEKGPSYNLKLGKGGLLNIEFIAQ
ncbi:MAG: hypothetical protein CSA65_05675 [Proteobacteria bacterium]|nr:MAG: hypothetical protein CSB49_02005 [Pseudomonadota bacterium]PIE18207.1 MAG: hypothetical protein CSA65_05675 [Pseudomonadota bacterium]